MTGQLRARGNSLVVMVNNTRRPGAIPAMNTDWWNYGGLTRSVRLVETPAVFIRAARVQCAEVGSATHRRVRGAGRCARPTPVTIEIPGANARADRHDRRRRARRLRLRRRAGALVAGVAQALRRHHLRGGERVHDRIGFRTIEAVGTEIVSTAGRSFLRGISLHEEALGRGGRATSRADAEALLGWPRSSVVTSSRLAHYPHNEEMTRAADRHGPAGLVGDPGLLDDRLGRQ